MHHRSECMHVLMIIVVNKEPQALEFPKLTSSSAAVIGSSLSTDNMMKPASGSISLMAYISFH